MLKTKDQQGMTFIELLIALVLGLIVSAAALNIFMKNMDTQNDNIDLMRLNQDMRSIMDLMVRDIRRAGFATTNPDENFDCLKSNPFNKMNLTNDGDSATCLVFAYNMDNDLAANVCTIEDTDRAGFKLSAGTIQMKVSGGSEASCDPGTWETISGSDITYAVTFTLNETEFDITEMYSDSDLVCSAADPCRGCTAGNQCLTSRDITISMTGTLDDGTTQTIRENVRIRNDEFDEVH
jgi:type IV pilus assembly protein PilW